MSKRDSNRTEEEEEEEDEQEHKVAHTHMHTPISHIDTKENKENFDFSRQKTKTKKHNGAQKQSKGCRIE